MDRETILESVTEILQDLFDDESLEVSQESTAKDIEGWDSLMHLQIISEIENRFDIKFSLAEIQGLANVGDLLACIEKHIEQ